MHVPQTAATQEGASRCRSEAEAVWQAGHPSTLRGQAYRMSPAQVTWSSYCESGTVLSFCHVFYCLILITNPYTVGMVTIFF